MPSGRSPPASPRDSVDPAAAAARRSRSGQSLRPHIGGHNGGMLPVLMHNQETTDYAGAVVQEIRRSLQGSVQLVVSMGFPPGHIVIDPGIGFGKTAEHNVIVLRRLEELHELGYPILVGVSRK